MQAETLVQVQVATLEVAQASALAVVQGAKSEAAPKEEVRDRPTQLSWYIF